MQIIVLHQSISFYFFLCVKNAWILFALKKPKLHADHYFSIGKYGGYKKYVSFIQLSHCNNRFSSG